MHFKFHVSDACNMRCNLCHWFSEEIIPMSKIKPNDIINFINRELYGGTRIESVSFTGGEPTLWPGLAKVINAIPPKIAKVIINTNGSGPRKLKEIERSVCLSISIHNEVDWIKMKECIDIAIRNRWEFYFSTFEGSVEEVTFPEWFDYHVKTWTNQISQAKSILTCMVGKRILCRPKFVYFATDGRAYVCEKGLRSKEDEYTEDFTLWKGNPTVRFRKCVADPSCLSSILCEQDYILANPCILLYILVKRIKLRLIRQYKQIANKLKTAFVRFFR
jgi:organic radical activating enzyme